MGIQRPGSSDNGDRIDMRTNLGRFLLVWPISHEEDIPTSFGDRDAIKANVLVMDDPTGPTMYRDVLLFGMGLIGQLKGAVGAAYTDPVAGRLIQGVAKAGQSPPWLLDDVINDAEIDAAEKWIAANPVSRLRAPAAATPPAAPPTRPVAAAPAPPAPPPPPVPPAAAVVKLSPAEVITYMAAGWTDGQLAALPEAPPMAALAAIRNQGIAQGTLTAAAAG